MNNNQLHNEHPDPMANIDGDANLTAGESEYDVEDILDVGSPDPSSGNESEAPNWDSEDHTEEGQGSDAGGAGDEAVHVENEEYEEGDEGVNDGDVEDESDDEDNDDADASEGERRLFIRSGAPSPEPPLWASA